MHISDGSADVCSSELGSYRLDWIAALFDSLHQWCHADVRTAPFEHEKLPNLTRDTLLLRTSKAGAGRTPESPICYAVPAYIDALAAMAEWKEARRVELLQPIGRASCRERVGQTGSS